MDFRTSAVSSDLPIKKFKNEILYLIENNSVVIVVGPTGSGKTTQIPQFLLEQGWAGIACTQPRRLSAMAMASRVSQELGLGGELGGIIGYSVRFDDSTSNKTLCRFITDGMLFRECLHDPLLSKYSVLIIDEAHERSLHTDLLLALIKKILPKRPELRVIISSATIDAEAFKRYFSLPRTDIKTGKKIYGPIKEDIKADDSIKNENSVNLKDFTPKDRFEPKIISIEGRTFPVEVEFLKTGPTDRMIQSEEVIIDGVVKLVKEINEKSDGPGDILVFLSGRGEIEKCSELLSQSTFLKQSEEDDVSELMGLFNSKKQQNKKLKTTKFTLNILQLYAGMNSSDQLKVFEPTRPGIRKVILSTNIAEASITIDGIVYVIDSGRVKIRLFTGKEDKMVTIPISKASADQRAGRAGRTRPGKAFRLYTREFFDNQMQKQRIPDLQLTKLTPIILQLKAMCINNLLEFDFLSPLPPKNVKSALEDLWMLKALNPLNGALSDPLGKQMAQLPLEPELGHFFLRSCEFNCPREGAALAAMLTIQNNQNDLLSTFFLPSENNPNYAKFQRRFWVEEGDHLTLLNIFMSYLANSENSVKFCQKYGLNLKNLTTVHRLYSTLLAYLKKVFKKPTDREIKLSTDEISILIRKSLISAYPLNVAKSDESRACYTEITTKTDTLNIHPNSVLFKRLPPLILYGQIIETTKKFLKFVTLIEADWLEEIHPQLYKQRSFNRRL